MDNKPTITVWITKYALTQGIFAKEVTDHGTSMVTDHERYTSFYHGEGREWHRTLESAVAQAEKIRLKKIASLEKEVAKLKALNFTTQHLTLE